MSRLPSTVCSLHPELRSFLQIGVKCCDWVPQAVLNNSSDELHNLDRLKLPTIFGSAECKVDSVGAGSLDLMFGFTCCNTCQKRCSGAVCIILLAGGKLILDVYLHVDEASAEEARTFEYIGVISTYSTLQVW